MKRDVEATTTMRAPLARVRKVLVEDPGCVLCDDAGPRTARGRRFCTELAVDLGSGTSVHQQVEVEVGRPATGGGNGDRLVLPLGWRPTGRDRLFPAFDGRLEAWADGLGTAVCLRGDYTVPLGPVGRVGEGVAGRRLALRSLTAFLDAVARRLEAEVARRAAVRADLAQPAASRRDLPTDCYLG